MTALPLPIPAELEDNVPCLRCGYNLRTLSASARCPECATPIASSLDHTLLRYADPSWTQMLSLALGLMIFSITWQALQLVMVLLIVRSQDLWSFGTLLVKGYQFAFPLYWLGVYLLGQRSLADSSPQRFSLRLAMRISALLNLGWVILPELKIINLPVDQLLNLVGTLFLFLYLLQTAQRTASPRLIRHACIAIAVMTLSDFAAISLNVFWDKSEVPDQVLYLFFPIFMYHIYVLHLFRRHLRKSEQIARRYWQFCSPIPLAAST